MDLSGISYLIEDVSYFAMLSCMVLLTSRLCRGILPIKLHMAVYTFTALMAVSLVIFTYALFPGFPSLVNVYGTIVYTSKLMVSLYLILLAFLGAVKKKSSQIQSDISSLQIFNAEDRIHTAFTITLPLAKQEN